MNFSRNLTFLVEYLDLPEAVGDPDANWEAFQLAHLNNPSLLAIELKSRQVGWSWLAAAESVASAILNPRTPHIFVSINQEEAAEKIRYAKTIIEALDKEVRPRLRYDNTLSVELENGSRLKSYPCRPIRGLAKAVVYLDEFAHYPNDDLVYQSALPVLSKGGVLRIGSSPMGARGRFWEIYTESFQRFPGYVRTMIPWWQILALCKDVPAATLAAPELPTEDRVRAFGSERLVLIFENMVLEDFQQEYECQWLDETVSWIDWDLIKRNQGMDADGKLLFRRAKGVDAALQEIDQLADDVVRARIEPALVGGLDVGRTRDTTEIILLGTGPYTNMLPYRLHITLDRVEFAGQEAVVEKLLSTLPVTSLLMDSNGLGMQLAENMAAKFPAAQGVTFSNQTKELWAVEAKLRAQRSEVPIPLNRDFAYQIHSIRRKVTAAKNSVYDTEGNEKHHADMFWAWALAIWAGKSDGYDGQPGVNPLSGYRG